MAKIYKKKGKVPIRTKFRKGVCVFCELKKDPTWMDYVSFEEFLSIRGGILSARVTSVCTRHQKQLTKAIKNARHLGLLPFVKR